MRASKYTNKFNPIVQLGTRTKIQQGFTYVKIRTIRAIVNSRKMLKNYLKTTG